MVGAKFGIAANAYAVGRERTPKDEPYQFQVARAKFVLCPSGMGWDTYRHWEVLLMGSIPVMESSPGFDRTFTDLPVLIVSSFDKVTDSRDRTRSDISEQHHDQILYRFEPGFVYLSVLQ